MIAAETPGNMIEWAFWLVLFVVNVMFVGVYGWLEMGFYRLNKMRLELYAEAGIGNRGGRILRRFAHNIDNLLTVLLVGTNIHSYVAAFAVSAMFMLGGCADRAEYYTMLVVVPVMFVFGDSVPKNLVRRISERVVYQMAWFLRAADIAFKIVGISYLVRGVSWIFLRLLPNGSRSKISGLIGPEGLLEIFTEAQASGTITSLQQQMAGRAMQIDTVRLIDACQPIDKIFTAKNNISRPEFLAFLKSHDFSRVPLVGAGHQISGIVDIHDVLADEKRLLPNVHATGLLVIAADTKITDAIYSMQQGRVSMSAVQDAGGKHIGIVTIKDLIEKIVGNLEEW